MDKAQLARRFGDTSMLIAVVTLLCYITSIMYQTGFYLVYGVDLQLVNLRLDPVYLILASSSLLFGIIILALTAALGKGMDFLYSIKGIKRGFIMDALMGTLVVLVLVLMLKDLPVDLQSRIITLVTIGLIAGLLVIMIAHDIIGTLVKKIKTGQGFIETYKKHSIWLIETKKSATSQRSRKLRINDYLIITSFLALAIGYMPFLYGQNVAEQKEHYTAINDPSTKPIELKLAVGQMADGLLIKKYDTKKEKFKSGYEVLSKDNQSYYPVKLNAIKPKED